MHIAHKRCIHFLAQACTRMSAMLPSCCCCIVKYDGGLYGKVRERLSMQQPGLCGMPACWQAVGSAVCDTLTTLELWRGAAGFVCACTRVKSLHTYTPTIQSSPHNLTLTMPRTESTLLRGPRRRHEPKRGSGRKRTHTCPAVAVRTADVFIPNNLRGARICCLFTARLLA